MVSDGWNWIDSGVWRIENSFAQTEKIDRVIYIIIRYLVIQVYLMGQNFHFQFYKNTLLNIL